MPTMIMGAMGRALDRNFLGQVPVFAGLAEQHLDWIIAAGTVGQVAVGVQVVSEGEAAASVFVVCDGTLEVCKRAAQGAEVRLAVLRAGDCVGEMSLIDIQPRSATVRALTPAVLFRLGNREIAKLYDRHPEVYTLLVLNIAREISRRLRVADQALVEMGVSVNEMWQSPQSRPST
ncbi:MAG TPA: cyclic nucleotide-binding domain-containing protein [Polyangia bacterium]|nr:cyclic nucleotide-binding domain-containing protein [Polyangia bacterium]